MIFTTREGSLIQGVSFIPYWIVEAVQSRRLPLKTVFEADKLMEFISKDDLCAYLALDNVKFQQLLFGTYTDSSGLNQKSIYNPQNNFCILNDSLKDKPSAVGEDFMRNIAAIYMDQSVEDEVEARLFTEESRNEEHKKPFIIYDITPERFGVVIYPGFFVGSGTFPLQVELMECLQKELYVHVPYNSVCASPLFRRYMQSMASSEVIAN